MKASTIMTFEWQAFMLFVFLFIMLLCFESIMQIEEFRNRKGTGLILVLLIMLQHIRKLGKIVQIHHTSGEEEE